MASLIVKPGCQAGTASSNTLQTPPSKDFVEDSAPLYHTTMLLLDRNDITILNNQLGTPMSPNLVMRTLWFCLLKIHHTGQYCCRFCWFLVRQHKVDKFNYILGNWIALNSPILAKVKFVTYTLQQPLYNKLFCNFAEKVSQWNWSEIILRLRLGDLGQGCDKFL